jgi:membrane-associated phospholipid phosphatase
MRRAYGFLLSLGPDTLVTIVALFALGLIAYRLGAPLDLVLDSAAPVVVLAALLLVTALARAPLLFSTRPGDRRRYLGSQVFAIRAWAPFVILYVCYRALRRTMNLIVTSGVEDQLRALDERLLGISPSWWFERFASPWLTDLMAFAYGLMFVLPLILLVLLYVKDWHLPFREVAVSILLAFYLGFFLYLIVPARSPRIVYEYATELSGALGLYELSTIGWDRLQEITYDAFPSLHTTISSISLAYAWRYRSALSTRREYLLFTLFLPCVVALQVSTLYLRQHYFVDLMGGWALAALCVWLAPRLLRTTSTSLLELA